MVDAPPARAGAATGVARTRIVKNPERRAGYVVVAPGLETVVAGEMLAIGLTPGATEPGGVAFTAGDDQLFAANLHLRVASRVLVRVAAFRATAFHELERLSKGVPWETLVSDGGTVRLRVSCHKSRLFHSDGVAQRVASGIVKRVKGAMVLPAARDSGAAAADAAGATEAAGAQAAQLFLVRFDHDICTISADSSGELLHRRGYRQATAKAPLRETLAAGSLLALRWNGARPLLDPMCGAGTIAIEAALIARRIAPGIARTFACERWPSIDASAFDGLRDAARSRSLARAPSAIVASDRDAGAIAAAVSNSARAEVANDIEFGRHALSAARVPDAPGLLLTNPPYGARVGDSKKLRNLYAQLGNLARARLDGWTLALLSADRVLDAQLKLPLADVIRFRNGGIAVRVVETALPVAKANLRA
jgi:putative N6-adenine-specific DNA methylase